MTLPTHELERLNAFVDDALDATERSAVETGVAGSPALRSELEGLLALDAELKKLPRPRGDDASIVDALRRAGRTGRTPRTTFSFQKVLAAVLLIAIGWLARTTLIRDLEVATPEIAEPTVEPGTVATLEFARGRVFRPAPGMKMDETLSAGSRLRAGELMGTDPDGRAIASGDAGATVWMAGDSLVAWTGERSLAIERGQLVVSVAAAADGEPPFTLAIDGLEPVATIDGGVIEIGTRARFSKAGPNATDARIRVVEGVLQVGARRVAAGESVRLVAGQVLDPDPNDPPSDARWFLELEAAARAER